MAATPKVVLTQKTNDSESKTYSDTGATITASATAASCASNQQKPPASFVMVADFKIVNANKTTEANNANTTTDNNKNGKRLKFLEYGIASNSQVRDLEKYLPAIERIISSRTNLPFLNEEEILQTPEMLQDLPSASKAANKTQFSDYRCIYRRKLSKPFTSLQTAPVLVLDDLEALHLVVANKLIMHEMFTRAGCLEHRPASLIIPTPSTKAFTSAACLELAKDIKSKIKAPRFAIKAPISTRGAGVFIVDEADLEITLEVLLCPDRHLEDIIKKYNASLLGKKSIEVLQADCEKAITWRNEANHFPSILVEECCPAIPYPHEGKLYDPTYRAVFVMTHEKGTVTFDMIYCYLKCPVAAINEPNCSLMKKIISSNFLEAVDQKAAQEIASILQPVMIKVFQEIIRFDVPSYILSLMVPNEIKQLDPFYYSNLYLQILNNLQRSQVGMQWIETITPQLNLLSQKGYRYYYFAMHKVIEHFLLLGMYNAAYLALDDLINIASADTFFQNNQPAVFAHCFSLRILTIDKMIESGEHGASITYLSQQKKKDDDKIKELLNYKVDNSGYDSAMKFLGGHNFKILKRAQVLAAIESANKLQDGNAAHTKSKSLLTGFDAHRTTTLTAANSTATATTAPTSTAASVITPAAAVSAFASASIDGVPHKKDGHSEKLTKEAAHTKLLERLQVSFEKTHPKLYKKIIELITQKENEGYNAALRNIATYKIPQVACMAAEMFLEYRTVLGIDIHAMNSKNKSAKMYAMDKNNEALCKIFNAVDTEQNNKKSSPLNS